MAGKELEHLGKLPTGDKALQVLQPVGGAGGVVHDVRQGDLLGAQEAEGSGLAGPLLPHLHQVLQADEGRPAVGLQGALRGAVLPGLVQHLQGGGTVTPL